MGFMGYTLLIDTSAIGKSSAVQKKLKLGEVLLVNTKYFSVEDYRNGLLCDSRWRPLKFATTVRSVHSNKVLAYYDKDCDRLLYYHTFECTDRLIHQGYDLVMFLASLSLMECLSDSADRVELNELMCRSSQFQCRGIYYNGVLVDPVVYSVIYIEDEAFESYFSGDNLKEGWKIMNISTMKEDSHGNIQALIDDIDLVKGE